MSSAMNTASNTESQSPKKRKHEGDTKEAKKKRKHTDDLHEIHEVEERPLKPRKEKKRKSGSESINLTQEEPRDTINGESEGVSTPKSEKKRKKKPKETFHAAQELEANPSLAKQADTESADVPADDAPTAAIVNHMVTVHDEISDDHDGLQIPSDSVSSFRSIRMSLYLPAPSIGLDKVVASMLALHVTPLLLTYFPPAGGVILSIHDPVLSATPQASLNQPLLPPRGSGTSKSDPHTYPKVGDEFGACWAWLTVTFLVYSPEPGDELQGWTNAMSEGFIGLVCYNYFQTSIAKSRIPKTWVWDGPSRAPRQRKTPRKGKLNGGDGPSQESQFDSQETIVAREDDAIDGTAGTFLDENGVRIGDHLKFRVVDLEMIPAQERGQLALQVEGTLLDEEEETKAKAEDRERFETRIGRSRVRARSRTPGTPMMSS